MKSTILAMLAAFMLGAIIAAPYRSAAAPAHPVMNRAIDQLRTTRAMLSNDAGKRFGGHRVNAIAKIDQAIAEVRLGIQFASK